MPRKNQMTRHYFDFVMKIVCLLLILGFFGHQTIAEEIDSVAGIQIITPKDHSFVLNIEELNKIVQNDDLKDRNVVVVSIAGAFRQGKSFLLNFFIKYLYAQYKVHDVTDWLEENGNNSVLHGFTWRGGRKRQTTGIWMWSEIFTHDFENGEKVAIILLDTQGIFDDKSSVRDCTTIFALSMMLSSVQCYNVMQNIKEDDLQHLELFTEYGRLALEQSEIKPFQRLLFIVRDWPYAYETDYGWHGQQVIDEILAGNDEQTHEMKQLRKRIDASFDEIGAFLMPYPGAEVAQGNKFTGDLKQIHPDFIRYVKILTPALFAPKNLAIKKINGQNMRVRDLITYLEAYTKIFNSDALPEPKTVFMATAEASNMILHNDCLNLYVDSMQNAFNGDKPFFTENELLKVHQNAKNEAISKFQEKPKLGGDRFSSTTQRKIEDDIEAKFTSFNQINEEKRIQFTEKANLHNVKLGSDIKLTFETNVINGLSDGSGLKHSDIMDLFTRLKQTALQEFEAMKMGDVDISNGFRATLEQNLDEFQSAVIKIAELHTECLAIYTNTMQTAIGQSASFLETNELIKTQQDAKKIAVDKFIGTPKTGGNELAYKFQSTIEKIADEKYQQYEAENKKKQDDFITKANLHNDNLLRELKASFENRMLRDIGTTFMSDSTFINTFISSKNSALDEFASRKLGGGDISNAFRERLERELDNLQASLKQANEKNRPVVQHGGKRQKGDLSLVGTGIGAAIGGPAGAAIGGAIGKLFRF